MLYVIYSIISIQYFCIHLCFYYFVSIQHTTVWLHARMSARQTLVNLQSQSQLSIQQSVTTTATAHGGSGFRSLWARGPTTDWALWVSGVVRSFLVGCESNGRCAAGRPSKTKSCTLEDLDAKGPTGTGASNSKMGGKGE